MELDEDHNQNQLVNFHEESCRRKLLQLPQKQELINTSQGRVRFTLCNEEERGYRSDKWVDSKKRVMGEMMNTHENTKEIQINGSIIHEIKDQKLTLAHHCSFTIRVCAECNTTKTPLWRSGPRGPKSLCNACGIRRMKARRSAMATVAGGILSAETPVKKTKKLKRESHNCHTQLRKRFKPTGEEKQFFEDTASRLKSKSQAFPEEEKEAAILLMALSCGLIYS